MQGGRGKVKGKLSLGAVVTPQWSGREWGKHLQCRLAAHCQWVGVPAPPRPRPITVQVDRPMVAVYFCLR